VILFHCPLESSGISRADLGENKVPEFLAIVHSIRADLPSAGFQRVGRGMCCARIGPFVPVPGGLKACENTRYLQHNRAAIRGVIMIGLKCIVAQGQAVL